MKAPTYRSIKEFWSRDLALDVGDRASHIHYTVQQQYKGVQMFRRRDAVVIASPPAHENRIRHAMQGLSPDEVFTAEWLAQTLGDNAEKILGPAKVNYADETTFRCDANGAPYTPVRS